MGPSNTQKLRIAGLSALAVRFTLAVRFALAVRFTLAVRFALALALALGVAMTASVTMNTAGGNALLQLLQLEIQVFHQFYLLSI